MSSIRTERASSTRSTPSPPPPRLPKRISPSTHHFLPSSSRLPPSSAVDKERSTGRREGGESGERESEDEGEDLVITKREAMRDPRRRSGEWTNGDGRNGIGIGVEGTKGKGKGKGRNYPLDENGNGSSSSVNDRVYPSTDINGNATESSDEPEEEPGDESDAGLDSTSFLNNDQDEEGYEDPALPFRRTFIGLKSRRLSAGGEGRGRRAATILLVEKKLIGLRSLSPALLHSSIRSTASSLSVGTKSRGNGSRNGIVSSNFRLRSAKIYGETTTVQNSTGADDPTMVVTIDSLTATFNPFSSFNFRWNQLPETLLLLIGLSIGIYRLYSIVPTFHYPFIPYLPVYPLLFLVPLVPLITLFRNPDHYYKLPFTDHRAYRDPTRADDGVGVAIVSPILLAIACFWDIYSNDLSSPGGIGLEGIETLGRIWDAGEERMGFGTVEVARVVFLARYQLFVITVLNTLVLLLHLELAGTVLRIEKLPLSNMKRFFGFAALSGGVSCGLFFGLKVWENRFGVFENISSSEIAVASFLQQISFYSISRLARRGFTVGELSIMTTAGNALCLEFWRLTRARWLFNRGMPTIPASFRAPTPLLVLQSVLIPGVFLSGFLLSPLLVLSRNIAGKPSHRLKWPTERDHQRKLLSAATFFSLFGIVFFLLGGWANWMLDITPRGTYLLQPWIWGLEFIFYAVELIEDDSGRKSQGSTSWKRIVLVLYWAGTISVAVGGWTTRFVRARRIRMKKSLIAGNSSNTLVHPPTSTGACQLMTLDSTNGSKNALATSVDLGSGGIKIISEGVTNFGVEGIREERKVHASLNMRRKFFHALAVTMFIPGIAVDPAFTSLAFSVAFALFTFSEYARYFALYPIGAPLHIFFSEFVDYKDSGPVILSHFYLLTGCAGGLWLEGRGIKRFTGVLVLGIGDAMASIVGKIIGRVRWPGTSKTIEGTIAFISSLVFCAWLLRITSFVEHFSLWKYTIVATLSALLEATSNQNDNLVIPLYMWSLLSLLNV